MRLIDKKNFYFLFSATMATVASSNQFMFGSFLLFSCIQLWNIKKISDYTSS